VIAKIRKVRDFRGFKNWTSPSLLPDFKDINLIYGANGSGKSTFASLLQGAATDSSWTSGLEVDVRDASETRQVGHATDPIWRQIRVFNSEYVRENLDFTEAVGGTAQPLLVLGKENVAAAQTRERCEVEIAAADAELPQVDARLRALQSSRAALLRDRARLISTELGTLGGRYDSRKYNALVLTKELGKKSTSNLASDLARDRQVVKEQALSSQPVPAVDFFSAAPITPRVKALLEERVTSAGLTELVENPDQHSWVEAGLALHGGRNTCIYCEGHITPERQVALEAHFDDSLRSLQGKISGLQTEIGAIRRDAQRTLAGMPKPTELFQSVREEYSKELAELHVQAEEWQVYLDWLDSHLAAKSNALFRSQALSPPAGTPLLELHKAKELLEKHNELGITLATKRQSAASRVEAALVSEIRADHDELSDGIRTCEMRRDAIEGQRRASQLELDRLIQDNFDPKPLVDRLNNDLKQLLGRSDLQFSITDNGYAIERNGSAAHNLSEGERNAISLLYFLCSLSSHDTNAPDCVIVVDDPVSSLDGNALAGASAHLWSELVGKGKCGQVFLLTHNFELFRMWSNQLDHNQRHFGQEPGTFEIRTRVIKVGAGDFVRVPAFISWPDDRNLRERLRSEYHYLFWRVGQELVDYRADPSIEREIEIATVLPNACRRLLEGFLGFKAPEKMGNLHDQVMSTGGNAANRAVRTRILRFLQAYSHNQEANTTIPVSRPESVEILNAVLEFMRAVDSQHFESMCEAVGIDKAGLAAAVFPDEDE